MSLENKKILVCAYSCAADPDKRFGDGGEGVLGWNMVEQIARFHHVWVLTHFKNQEAIEKKLAQKPMPTVNFVYIRLPGFLERLNKIHGGIQSAAYLWQIKAYFVARKLNREIRFDLFHHVTYANDWMASYMGAFLPIPFVRGPGGGAHRVPAAFVKEYSFKDRMLEKLRSAGQWVFRHDPVFIIGRRKAGALLVCNQEAFNAIPKKYHSKAALFPVNGVSESDIASAAPVPHNQKFTVLSVGKLLKLKSFDLALRSFALFHEKVSESEFIIIGEGPEFSRLQALAAQLSITQAVRFEQWMPREKMMERMRSCDVFLFPSLRDGGGAVVVEAMAAAKPVICFDIAGPGLHVTNDCGIKIKPKNPTQVVQELAQALARLHNDTMLRETMGRAAQERARTFYLWDSLGDRLQEIYHPIFNP